MSTAVVARSSRRPSLAPPHANMQPTRKRPSIVPRGIPSKPVPSNLIKAMAPVGLASANRSTPSTASTSLKAAPSANGSPEPPVPIFATPSPSSSTASRTPTTTAPESSPIQGAASTLPLASSTNVTFDRADHQNPFASHAVNAKDIAPRPSAPERRDEARQKGRPPPPTDLAATPLISSTCDEPLRGTRRQGTLGALVIYADWSEACTLFVPKALAALRAHPELADGALAVHVDAESCLCAYYAVDALPCIIFRARPRAPSWRWRGVARPVEIPRTRIVGACSERALAERIDAAVAAFCLVVPADVDAR